MVAAERVDNQINFVVFQVVDGLVDELMPRLVEWMPA